MSENKDHKNVEFKVLDDLKNKSRVLIKKMLPIMKELDNHGVTSDIIDEVNYCTQADKPKILEFLQTSILEMIKDAQHINTEINVFSNILQKEGEEGIDNNLKTNTFPFLASVWFGDVYDKDGIEALNMLLLSVTENLKMAGDDELINLANKHFTGT